MKNIFQHEFLANETAYILLFCIIELVKAAYVPLKKIKPYVVFFLEVTFEVHRFYDLVYPVTFLKINMFLDYVYDDFLGGFCLFVPLNIFWYECT